MRTNGKAIVLTLFAAVSTFCNCSNQKEDGQAKYIFLMIGDGMSASSVAAAESYLSYKEGKLGGEQLRFTQFPVYGNCTTHSANTRVTCSSAAATAISTGHKTNNYMLCVDPEGNHLKSMTYALKEQGYRIGIASTVPVNHATPAAFYASAESRGDYYNITLQIPESGFDFFAGSGIIDITGSDKDKEALDEILKREGYDVCYGIAELNESDDNDGVLLLEPSQRQKALNYEVKHDEKDDSASDIMQAAIDFLGEEKPFFIMYEGGEIDWAAHDNNLPETIESIKRFDEAITVAYEFYLKHSDETLIVVTADHETGGITLGGKKNSYDLYWENFENREEKGLDVKGVNDETNIGWTSNAHTGGPVPVYAIGKGAERFNGRMDNTDFYKKIVLN